MNTGSLIEKHPIGFKGLFKLYPYEKLWKGLIISLVVSLIINLCFILCDCNPFEIIVLIISDVLAIIPNLIGFVLAGYAIVVGFGNREFLKSTSESKNGKMSFYQTYSYIYAFSLIILISTLMTAVLFKFLSVICCPVATECCLKCINYIGLFIIIFLVSLSLISLLYMVINVFNLAQMHHFALTLERMTEKREETPEQENMN